MGLLIGIKSSIGKMIKLVLRQHAKKRTTLKPKDTERERERLRNKNEMSR